MGDLGSADMTPDQRAVVEVVRETFGEPETVEFPEVWGPRVVVGATTPKGAVFTKAAGDADVRAEAAQTFGLSEMTLHRAITTESSPL
ncbi:hypothetical protein GCM10009872_53830 [Actinopolymorpha rutila]